MPTFKTSDGLSLYYTDSGPSDADAPVLLCLAGLTRNHADFQFVLPHLTDYRTVCLDCRGRGESDYDTDYANYNVIQEARDVVELIAHLDCGPVIVIGTSRGGMIAMALSASHPELLAGALLNDIGPVIDTSGIARIMGYVGKPPVATDLDSAAVALAELESGKFFNVPLERWRAEAEAMYRPVNDHLELRYDARLHNALLDQAATGTIPEMWMFFEALRKKPLAVVRGANSDLLSDETIQEMQRRHPGLIARTVPDRGHVPFLDEPEALEAIHALVASIQESKS